MGLGLTLTPESHACRRVEHQDRSGHEVGGARPKWPYDRDYPRACVHPRPRRVDSHPVIWHADGRFTRLEGAPYEEYAAALGRELAAAPGGVFIGRGWVRRRNAAALRGSC